VSNIDPNEDLKILGTASMKNEVWKGRALSPFLLVKVAFLANPSRGCCTSVLG